ncbi:putative amino acid transporter [Xylariomycetidae sp. FL0641]|nr:putative amino acid transporter [Xylariomycetidae sp. FL0641]
MKAQQPSDVEGLEPIGSRLGEVVDDDPQVCHDAVFGDITNGGPDYRNVGWVGTAVLMMKTQIGLGVLSIPAAFDSLGLVPGAICLVVIAIITTWSDYMVGVFKLRHREVYSIDDAGLLMFGRIGQVIFGFIYLLYYIFASGSAILSLSIGLNAVSTHAACTAIFVAVGAIIAFSFSSIQTLGRISWLAWIGLTSLITSILIVTIAVGIQDRPASAPQQGPWSSDYQLFARPSFTSALSSISGIVFAYAGTPAFFALAAEMREPRYYTRSLVLCQSFVTVVYLTIGIVVYYFCGSYVASPALGSAGVLIKKIAYGISLPGLVVTACLLTHFPAKYAFVTILRGSRHLTANSPTHWAAWLGCTSSVTVVAYLIASGIPVFGGLVSLIGALLGTFMSFQPMGCMWLYDNWNTGKAERTTKWTLMVCWSVFVIVSGTFLTIAGTYACIHDIIASYKESGGSAAWACADNSGSV